MHAATARLCLLDGFRVSVENGPGATTVDPLPQGIQRLIAYLGLCGRPARGAVAGTLWPDVPETHARGSLRSALWRVQRAVPGLVVVSGDAVSLAEGVQVDVRELVDWARAVQDPGSQIGSLDTAAAALAGELLPGWYEEWVLLERERFRQLRVHALERLAERLVLHGRHGEAVQAACAAVRYEPLRESAHRALVRVHLAEGNLAEAMRAYCSFRDLSARELGVLPTRLMEELVSPMRARGEIGDRVVVGVPAPRSGFTPSRMSAPAG